MAKPRRASGGSGGSGGCGHHRAVITAAAAVAAPSLRLLLLAAVAAVVVVPSVMAAPTRFHTSSSSSSAAAAAAARENGPLPPRLRFSPPSPFSRQLRRKSSKSSPLAASAAMREQVVPPGLFGDCDGPSIAAAAASSRRRRRRRRNISPMQLLLMESKQLVVKTRGRSLRYHHSTLRDDDGSDEDLDDGHVNDVAAAAAVDDDGVKAIRNVAAAATARCSADNRKAVAASAGVSFWPPWPFNHLSASTSSNNHGGNNDSAATAAHNGRNGNGNGNVGAPVSKDYRKDAKLIWRYLSHRAVVAARVFRQVSTDVSFHLPPAAPPLLLIALLPSRQNAREAADAVTRTAIRQGSSSFVRRVSLTSLGVAVISWAHYEIRQQKRLVPLPLREEYRDYKKAVLPPFLPPIAPPLEEEFDGTTNSGGAAAASDEVTEKNGEASGTKTASPRGSKVGADDELLSDDLKSRVRRELEYLYKAAPKPDKVVPTVQEFIRKRTARSRREENIRRKAVVEELLALQALKKISRKKNGKRRKNYGSGSTGTLPGGNGEEPLGYALVTGASRGIGRALAVELARYEVPLILVARDMGQLKTLADEIMSCYGVQCCILQADLSKADAAAKVYRSTKTAGLRVDILVNNAGICTHGEMVDTPLEDIRQMVQINAGSVATLSHLYGKDMKRQGRGRILFVSSIVGSVPAGPGVATYAATKSFEKSLALSMGKELEQYGCGVTCLMPGAVKGTAFRTESNTDDAVCWKIPFYPKTAEVVAHRGVQAMLAGDPEVCPGWMNKVFLRVVTPMLPQRLTTLIVEFAWNPLKLPWQDMPEGSSDEVGADSEAAVQKLSSSSLFAPFWESSNVHPRVLTAPGEEKRSKGIKAPPTSDSKTDVEASAGEGMLEVLRDGDEAEGPAEPETSQTYPSAEDYLSEAVANEEKRTQQSTGVALDDTSAASTPDVFDPTTTDAAEDGEATEETGDSLAEDEETSSRVVEGDAMIGVLAGEIEAGLADIIPPPSEPSASPTTDDEVAAETPKSDISILADEIEAEVMKLIPVPEDGDVPPAPSTEKNQIPSSPRSVIQEKDLDLLQYLD
mmetsp:Transcript_26222/g.56818  ORF Transcript_26222/g.56818 Transcript_26222/m.56818 type:complete len:1082 (-) Transcript_26222:41-3286(-)